MEAERVVELGIPSELGYEKMAMQLSAAVAHQMGFEPERIDDLKTAVSEACLNAIEHGNQLDADARVVIRLQVEDDRLLVDVYDQGRGGPPPAEFPEPDINRKIAGQEETRRMGIYVIRQLVDEAGFVEAPPDGGNQFRIVMLRCSGERGE
jgi:serine/threonine-protein kinase RsbW